MEKKYLNISEAEQLLPKIQQSLVKLMELNNALGVLKQINIKYDDHFEDMYKEVSMNKKFFELNYMLFKELEILLNMGCIVKDLNAGLVDFFSKHKGKDILLCWKVRTKVKMRTIDVRKNHEKTIANLRSIFLLL